jgi:hypothetical protein
MTERFLEFTIADDDRQGRLILVSLRAIASIEANYVQKGSIIHFSHMEDDFIEVVETYDEILAAMGWTRVK